MYLVYMLLCADDSLYTAITNDFLGTENLYGRIQKTNEYEGL